MTQSGRKIFVSYRRADHVDFVERIRDWFVMRYGRDAVFMDFDTIPPFTRFADFIRERVRECDMLVAIIGPRWLELLHERLDADEEDYVQTEIRLALEEGKLIAPICIKGAAVPRQNDLPPDLRGMLDYNVAHLDSGRAFLDDIERIMDAVEMRLAELEGLSLIASEMRAVSASDESPFNIRRAVEAFQAAADNERWYEALDWLNQIRESGYMPRFYPIDDYEQEVRAAIARVEAERDYDIIRLMAARVRSGRESAGRVWHSLLAFWETQPGYDPDDLAAEFQPVDEEHTRIIAVDPLALDMEPQPVSPPPPPVPAARLDARIFDQVDAATEAAADALFDLDRLAAQGADVGAGVSIEQAVALGILNPDNFD